VQPTTISEAVGVGRGVGLLHELYIPTNPFLSVVQHWFSHVTIRYFTAWLERSITAIYSQILTFKNKLQPNEIKLGISSQVCIPDLFLYLAHVFMV